MLKTWRLLDTGLRSAAENIALNRALLEARAAGEAPSTLRFLRFLPSALIGYHQSPEQELDLDYCARQGIAVQRRITGGGAICFDEGQLGWELYLDRREMPGDMATIARRICEAAARGISALGVNARFRPRNDIEVGGRKLSGTGGVVEGDALMYQGTLLVRFDVERMLRVLRIPAEKLSDKAIASARERIVTLEELLGTVPPFAAIQEQLARAFAEAFGVDFAPGGLSDAESARFAAALAEIDTPDWVHALSRPASEAPLSEALRKFPAGLVRVGLAYDRARDRIKHIQFTGDFFVEPRRAIPDLEAALRDTRGAELEANIQAFFAARSVDMAGLAPGDLAQVAREAIGRAREAGDEA